MTRAGLIFGRLVLTVAAVNLVFVSGEAALRLLGVGENTHTTVTLDIYAPDPQLGWVLKPNMRVTRPWAGHTVVIRTDAEGHRIPDHATTGSGAARVAFAGDSFVMGNEVNAEDTFAHLVGRAMSTRTVNLGVSGYALSQECQSLRRFMTQASGITHAFLIVYLGNDLEYGAYPPSRRGVDADGYLHDEPPATTMKAHLRVFAVRHSLLLFDVHDALERIRGEIAARRRTGRQPGYRWIYDEAAFTRNRLDAHRKVLAALCDDARIRGVPLTVVMMPEREQVYGTSSDLPNRRLSAVLRELGIPAIDLLPLMRGIAARRPPLWHDLRDGHLSTEGHRFVAEVLVDYVRRHSNPSPGPGSLGGA